ncbi:helix-turn-helix domain-containing protein [Kribbella sp. NPDC056951]|uniref:helix-turn-helix domain-containing protein n=1 Tax=Kribbella sp. NPDC056951 TaxID=3345978 RepID=UPI0036333D73
MFGSGEAVHQRLGGLLRGARKLAGLSGTELSARLGVSQSKLSRIELGQSSPTPDLAGRWSTICGISPERAGEISDLAEQIATETSPAPWHGRAADGIAQRQGRVSEVESASGLTLTWHPRLIPGLLQTPAYAREIFACTEMEQPELNTAVAARMARQALLYDPDRAVRLLVGEAALRWPIASVATLVAQLDRLSLFAADGTVRFGIVPFARPFGAFSYHAWSVMADRDDEEPDLVHVELETATVDITDPEQTAAYRDAFERLSALALTGDRAVDLIRRIRQELTAA